MLVYQRVFIFWWLLTNLWWRSGEPSNSGRRSSHCFGTHGLVPYSDCKIHCRYSFKGSCRGNSGDWRGVPLVLWKNHSQPGTFGFLLLSCNISLENDWKKLINYIRSDTFQLSTDCFGFVEKLTAEALAFTRFLAALSFLSNVKQVQELGYKVGVIWCNVNPGLINHGLLIRGYSLNSYGLILKWHLPN